MRLQSTLASFVVSPGQVPFNKYRAFKNGVRQADEPFRFVDGELVEQFLNCSSEMQEAVLNRMGAGTESLAHLKAMIEGLKRMH